jgi:peptide/nickel transport system permease protein
MSAQTSVGDVRPLTGATWTAPTAPRFQTWRRFRRNYLAVIALVYIILVTLTAIFAPLIAPYDPVIQNTRESTQPPSTAHPLGTDQYGRDVFSRLVYGGRVSLSVGVVAVAILISVGTLMGALSGYYGGRIDILIMRFVDVMLCLPQFFLLLAAVAVFGPSILNTMLLIGLTSWMGTARLVRGQFLSLRNKEFVTAARVCGAQDARIIRRHMLVNTIPIIIVQATLSISAAILIEASLSYLGLGAQPPTPSWGNMLADGKNFMRSAWWLTFFPGLAVFTTVLSFNLVGDGLREVLDPRLKQ